MLFMFMPGLEVGFLEGGGFLEGFLAGGGFLKGDGFFAGGGDFFLMAGGGDFFLMAGGGDFLVGKEGDSLGLVEGLGGGLETRTGLAAGLGLGLGLGLGSATGGGLRGHCRVQDIQCSTVSQMWPLGLAHSSESTLQGIPAVFMQLCQQKTSPAAQEPESRSKWRTGSSEAAAEAGMPPQPAVGAKCGMPLLKAAYTCSR